MPLADKIRPKTLEDVVGQTHLLGEGKPLLKIIKSGKFLSPVPQNRAVPFKNWNFPAAAPKTARKPALRPWNF